MHDVLIYILGLASWAFAVGLGRMMRGTTDKPYSYVCFEEDCDFEMRSSNFGMLNEAVVFHWGEHPTERKSNAPS